MKRTNSRITRNSGNAGARRRMASRECARTTAFATPPAPPPAPRKPLRAMTPEETRAWIQGTRSALEQKQAREWAYLDHRAHRGIHTLTDDAYEQDHQLEDDLLAMLGELEAHL